MSTEPCTCPSQCQPRPFCLMGAVNQAVKEAHTKPLIIFVETYDIEGGACCFTFCVRVSFPLTQEVYSFLSCLFLLDWKACFCHCLINGNMFLLGSHHGCFLCLNMVQRVDPFKCSYMLLYRAITGFILQPFSEYHCSLTILIRLQCC